MNLKKIVIVLCTLNCAVFSFATDESETKAFKINDFSGGLNTHISEFNTDVNESIVANNVRFNKKFSSVAKRDPLESYGTLADTKVTSLYRYYKNDDTKYLIATGGTSMYVGDDDAGTFTTLKTGLTDGKRWDWVTYKDIAIGMNGSERAIKWDGSTNDTANTAGNRTADNLIADLGAPIADLTTGTNLDASSWYQYKVLFRDTSNFYYSDARSNPILTGAAVYTIALTDVPLGESGTVERQIYRTEGNASQVAVEADGSFKYVGTISDNSTRTYKDIIADGSLGALLSTSGALNVTPPYGKYGNIHDQRLFTAGDPDNKSFMYYSDQFNPDYFLATNFVKIRPDDGDDIEFIKTFLGILTIGKTNSIQKYYTEGSAVNWTLSDPFSFIGTPAPYTARVTPVGIVYLGRYGLYAFNGQGTKLISDAVSTQIKDINQSNIAETFGMYWNNEYQLAYTSSETGSSENDRVLSYDTVRDAYALDLVSVNCMASLESGTDNGAIYYGHPTSGSIDRVGASETEYTIRKQSEFELGTFDDARALGTELDPILEMAWDLTMDGDFTSSGHGYLTMDGYLTASGTKFLMDRPDTDGDWTSQVKKINADTYEKLYWNENLNAYGDVEFQVRSGASTAAAKAATWSTTYSTPSGSDVSALTANDYVQLKANLSTSNLVNSPKVFLADGFCVRFDYSKEGAVNETVINSNWTSGWKDFGVGEFSKLLKRIRIYYVANTGTLTITYRNIDGDITQEFDIDMSIAPDDSETDDYTGYGDNKVYTYYPAEDHSGEMWQFEVTDTGITSWQVSQILVLFQGVEYVDL